MGLVLLAKATKPAAGGVWRRDGAVIYPSGDAVKIEIGVLYNTDSWSYNSEIKVKRLRMGASVRIQTALKRPLMEQIIKGNHNLICVGLSSRENEGADGDRDIKLAVARGYNLGHAVKELGWMPGERIYPLWLGASVNPAEDEEQAILQRSALIIGVNSATPVLANDMLVAAMQLIDREIIDLNSYTRSPQNPGVSGVINSESGQLLAKDVILVAGRPSNIPIVLPPKR